MIAQPIPAGDYLRLRREASGLSVDDVALLISEEPADVAVNARLLRETEAGRRVPPARFITLLCGAFRFDHRMFDLLVFVAMDMRVCRSCACSDLCRCAPEEGGECAWSTEHPSLCTHCVHHAAAIAPALPFPTA